MTSIIGFQDNQNPREQANRGRLSLNDTVVLETADGQETVTVGQYIRGQAGESLSMQESTRRAKELLRFSGLPLGRGLSFWFSARFKRDVLVAQKIAESNHVQGPKPARVLKQITLAFRPDTFPFMATKDIVLRDVVTLTCYENDQVVMTSRLHPDQSWTFQRAELEHRGYFPLGKITKTKPDNPKINLRVEPQRDPAEGRLRSKIYTRRIIKEERIHHDMAAALGPSILEALRSIPKEAVDFMRQRLDGYEGLLPTAE